MFKYIKFHNNCFEKYYIYKKHNYDYFNCKLKTFDLERANSEIFTN